jgi:hypothetical protein
MAMKFINDQADAVRNAWLCGMFWRSWYFAGNFWIVPPLLSRLTDDTTHMYCRIGTV